MSFLLDQKERKTQEQTPNIKSPLRTWLSHFLG